HQGCRPGQRPGAVGVVFHHHQQPQGADGRTGPPRPGHLLHPAPAATWRFTVAPCTSRGRHGIMPAPSCREGLPVMGYRLSKIYTRTGDQGETGLADGRRVAKDHPRIEAIGEVDMLNSQLGLLIAELVEQQSMWPALGELLEVLEP